MTNLSISEKQQRSIDMTLQESSTHLLDLPSELLGQILSHVILSGLRFKFENRPKRKYGDFEADIDGLPSSDHSKQPSEWKPIVSATRLCYPEPTSLPSIEVIKHIGELGIVSIFLICRKLLPIVEELFYQSNKFWFLDLFSLQSFAAQISDSARQSIRKLTVHVCGMARFDPERRRFYEFEHKPDFRFAQAISVFAGLRQVRLHGIGPEVEKFKIGSEDFSWESPNVWTLPCLNFVRRIIGDDGRRSELNPAHALFDGQVVCRRLRLFDLGKMRIYGTWIVRKDVKYSLDKWKQKIDVALAYEHARD